MNDESMGTALIFILSSISYFSIVSRESFLEFSVYATVWALDRDGDVYGMEWKELLALVAYGVGSG